MNIVSNMQNASLSHSLVEVVQNAKPDLSFWGIHSVKIANYLGSTSVDFLAQKVISIVRDKHFEFTPEERIMGKAIARHINRLYKESDSLVKTANLFTRLMCLIRAVFVKLSVFFVERSSRSHTRLIWEKNNTKSPFDDEGYKNVFDYYTPRQFREKYGRQPRHIELDFLFGVPGDQYPELRLAKGIDE